MSVYELVENSSIIETETGYTGTRTFTNADNSATPVTLPKVGDTWKSTAGYPTDNNIQSSVYDILIVRTVTRTLLSPGCLHFKWSVDYSTKDEDNYGGTTSENDLPVSIRMGAEMITWTPPAKYASNFKWRDATGYITSANNTNIQQNLQRLINITTYTFTRRVTELTSFKLANYRSIGRINSSTFYGLPRGLLLYQGADIDSYKDNNGRQSWLAKLTFAQRITSPGRLIDSKTGGFAATEVDGWQYALRESDGAFSRPLFTLTNSYLFEYANFKNLITSGYGIFQPQVTEAIGT